MDVEGQTARKQAAQVAGLPVTNRKNMPLGHRPLGSGALGTGPSDFTATFDLDRTTRQGTIIATLSLLDRKLIERLHQYPSELRTIDRRAFEELVAELFASFGYDIELTNRTRDGGKDIVAVKTQEPNGIAHRLLIECKRPDPNNPVSVSTVRELYGVKSDDHASKAIIATTTYLTRDAKAFVQKHKWELEAREYEDIKDWIARYIGFSG